VSYQEYGSESHEDHSGKVIAYISLSLALLSIFGSLLFLSWPVTKISMFNLVPKAYYWTYADGVDHIDYGIGNATILGRSARDEVWYENSLEPDPEIVCIGVHACK